MNLGRWTYFVWLLGCGVPVLVGQWAISPKKIAHSMKTNLLASFFVGTYLASVDRIAITQRIWTFSKERTLGVGFYEVPLEEILFFLLTSLLVCQSMALFSETTSTSKEN